MTVEQKGRALTMRKVLVMGLTAAAIMIELCSCPVADAQTPATLLGTWEGRVTFGESAPATLEFSEDAGTLKWKYSFKYDAAVLWGDAAGTVTSFSPPALELAGAYTKHAVPGAVGTGVKFTLTVDGDHMKGTVVAEMNNEPVAVSLTKRK